MSTFLVDETSNLSDDYLISGINSGRYEYLGPLINRYMSYIVKIAGKYKGCGLDTEDLIQEGTLALFSAVKSFKEDKSSFSNFAFICINRSIVTQLRAHNAAHRVPGNLISPLDEVELFDENSPENIFIEKESYLLLANAIKNDLSKLEYNVFYEFLAGCSYVEIADKLHISVKSVDNALKRIRTKLKK